MDTDARSLRAGAALESCYREHGARVYRLCLQMLGQPADAEDAAQEVFLKVLDRSGQFEGRAAFSTWLHRLTVNLCLNRLERERLRVAVPLSPEEGALAAGQSPWPQAAARAAAARVTALLARLPLEHRLVLHLREVEGLAYREIAAALGIPLGTVMSRIARARESLSRLVGCARRDEARPSPLRRSLA
jgi:RNA polymerase sigma-70 factor (ECF subfamily)